MHKQVTIITISFIVAFIIATLSYAEPTLTVMVAMRDEVKLATDV